MVILTGILNFFKAAFSAKYIAVTFAVIIVGLFIWNIQTSKSLTKKISILEQNSLLDKNNREALMDTISNRVDKKVNKSIGEKMGYVVTSVGDLQNYNKNLYSEFKSMGNTVSGIQSQLSINLPTIISAVSKPITDPKDSTKMLIPWNFSHSDPGLSQVLVGKTQFRLLNNRILSPIISTLDTNKISISLNYGFIEKDGKYIVQANSPSKLISFTELNGALVLDKFPQTTVTNQNPWSFGPYMGVGLNTDLTGQNSRFGWSIGIGASYNFFSKIKGGKLFK